MCFYHKCENDGVDRNYHYLDDAYYNGYDSKTVSVCDDCYHLLSCCGLGLDLDGIGDDNTVSACLDIVSTLESALNHMYKIVDLECGTRNDKQTCMDRAQFIYDIDDIDSLYNDLDFGESKAIAGMLSRTIIFEKAVEYEVVAGSSRTFHIVREAFKKLEKDLKILDSGGTLDVELDPEADRMYDAFTHPSFHGLSSDIVYRFFDENTDDVSDETIEEKCLEIESWFEKFGMTVSGETVSEEFAATNLNEYNRCSLYGKIYEAEQDYNGDNAEYIRLVLANLILELRKVELNQDLSDFQQYC